MRLCSYLAFFCHDPKDLGYCATKGYLAFFCHGPKDLSNSATTVTGVTKAKLTNHKAEWKQQVPTFFLLKFHFSFLKIPLAEEKMLEPIASVLLCDWLTLSG